MLYYIKLDFILFIFFAYCPPLHNCFKTFLMVHCMANIWYYHTYKPPLNIGVVCAGIL